MTSSSAKKTSFDLSRAYPIGCTLNTIYTVTGIICSTVRYNLYRARDRRTGRNVTIKELTRAKISREGQADLFQSEIRALNRAQHPNLPLMLDHFSDRGNLYIVFEHITGMCLGEMLSAEGPLPHDLVFPIFLEIAQGLSAAHDAGVVHNELTPASIFLLGDTDSQQIAKLTDFGSATILDDSAPPPARKSSRPEYASPEALRAEPTDARSDIYSIGVILYMSLTGRLPFACEDMNELIECQMKGLPRRFKDAAPELNIPFHVEATVFKCLDKNREERFQSAQELAKWLRTWKHATQPVEAEPPRDIAYAEKPKAYSISELNNIGAPKASVAAPSAAVQPAIATPVQPLTAGASNQKAKAQPPKKLKAQAREEARLNAELEKMENEAEKIRTGAFKKFEMPIYLTAAVMAGIMGFVVTVNIRHAMNAKEAEREAFNWTHAVPERTKRLIAAKENAAAENSSKAKDQDQQSQAADQAEPSTTELSQTNEISPENTSVLSGNDSNAVNQEAPLVPIKPGEPVQFEGEQAPQAPAVRENQNPPSAPEIQQNQTNQSTSDTDLESRSEIRYDSDEYAQPKPRRAYQTSYQ